MKYKVLTEEQKQHFIDKGHIVISQAFPRDLAVEWREFAFRRLGYDADDPSTWKQERVHMPSMNSVSIQSVSPYTYDAICDLLGGQDRLSNPNLHWRDGFIINFSVGADREWQPPSSSVDGWHKDGDFFRHFLDSPEQGLLTIVIWSDIHSRSGGTFLACDSVKHIAKYLLENPQGLLPHEAGFGQFIHNCQDFIEITGQAGDVILIHPFVLHAGSQNPSGRARFIANPPVALKEPMNFNRKVAEAFSPVELAVLEGLEVDQLDFKPTSPHQRIVPERVKREQKILEEQKARLALHNQE